ncbi:MAG: accessory gene regulator B family protein [Bacillota bacterium]|nr:accessory gene regulator B family protein [Bacillota bacterium]MDW7683466.1 accessory gene regulator B family protein [Bacillota bacterium]
MNAADRFLSHLASELGLDTSQSEIVRYGLQTLLFTLAGILTVVVFATVLGLLRESLVIMSVVMVYRKVSGGAHCHTPLTCTLVGTAAILGLARLAVLFGSNMSGSAAWIFSPPAVALVIAFICVPADVPQKPITAPTQRRMLRMLAFIMLLSWAAAGAASYIFTKPGLLQLFVAGNLGLLWQSLLLTPPGYRLIDGVNAIFHSKVS